MSKLFGSLVLAVLLVSNAHAEMCNRTSADQPCSQGRPVYNVKDYGAVGNGVTNDRTAIISAITACSTYKGTVYLPAGTYVMTSGITLSGFIDCTIQGAGREATVIDCSTVTGADCFASNTTLNRYMFRDLTLRGATSGGSTPNLVKVRKTDKDVRFNNVGFNLTTGSGIYCSGCTNVSVVDSEFYSDGDFQSATEIPRGIYVNEAADNLLVERSGFYFLFDSIYMVGSSTSPVRNIRILNNTFDSAGFTNKARYTNSGGTVSYSGNTLVDSSNPFTASGIAATTIVRVLTTVGTGTVTSTSGDQVTDSGANFATSVIRGDIIRTSTAFALVERRVSSTTLATTEWRDLTTYRPVATPTNSTAYTLYDTVLGEVANSNNTTSTITVNQWFDPAGVTSTPSSGTLYEVSYYRGQYGIKSTTGVNNVTVSGNLFQRTSAAAAELSGSGTIFTGNTCKDGLDGCIGIQGGGRATITNNVSDHTYFFAALYLGATSDGQYSTVSNNVVSDTHWCPKGLPPTYTGFPIVIRSSDYNIITHNILQKGSIVTGTSQYGIFIDDDAGTSGDDATANYLASNSISGFDTASIRLEDVDVAGTVIRDLLGATISSGVSVAGTIVDGQSYGTSALPVFNVKSYPYSALGNGSNDDTDEINAAITAANASSYSGTVFFPPGQYKVTGRIGVVGVANKQIKLQGSGMDSTLIYTTSSPTVGFPIIGTGTPFTCVGGTGDATTCDDALGAGTRGPACTCEANADCQSNSCTGGTAVRHATISDMTIGIGHVNGIGIDLTGMCNSVVERVHIIGYSGAYAGRTGILMSNASGSACGFSNSIAFSHIEGNAANPIDYAVRLRGAANDNIFLKDHFGNYVTTGVSIEKAGGWPPNANLFTGNNFQNIVTTGLSDGGAFTRLIGNRLESNESLQMTHIALTADSSDFRTDDGYNSGPGTKVTIHASAVRPMVFDNLWTDSPASCDASHAGFSYWDASLHEKCVCISGTGWVQSDGGGGC